MEITAEPTNRFLCRPSKKNHPKNSANIHFWAPVYKMYLTVSKFVLKKLILFATTWLCEAGFSAMCVLKIKHQNRLKVVVDLQFRQNKISP